MTRWIEKPKKSWFKNKLMSLRNLNDVFRHPTKEIWNIKFNNDLTYDPMIHLLPLSQLQIKRSESTKQSHVLDPGFSRACGWGGEKAACGLITPSLEAGGGAAVVRIIVSTSTSSPLLLNTFQVHNPRPQPQVSVALVPANCASQSYCDTNLAKQDFPWEPEDKCSILVLAPRSGEDSLQWDT